MILRDLITRITFQADTTPIRRVDSALTGIKSTIRSLAAALLTGFTIKTGTAMLKLGRQFEELRSGKMVPLLNEINRLSGDLFGKPSIFSEEQLQRAGVSLMQLGIRGKEAADLLRFAALVSVRGGLDIEQMAERLGSGIMSGGLADELLRLKLITPDVRDTLKIIENEIASGAGKISPRVTRAYREKLFAAIDRKELQKNFEEMLGGPLADPMRLSAQATNFWNKTSKGIVTAIGPLLSDLAEIFDWASDIGDAIAKWRKPIQEFSDEVRAFLKWVNQPYNLPPGKATLGGESTLKPGETPLLFQDVRKFFDWFYDWLPGTPESKKKTGGSPPPQGSIGQGGTNLYGDINLHISTQATDGVEISKVVVEELSRVFRGVAVDQAGSYEPHRVIG